MPEVVVCRTGNARIRRASINGVQLAWDVANPSCSQPKQLPAGEYLFQWYVKGDQGETFGFYFVSPAGVPCVVNPAAGLPAGNSRDWGECPFTLTKTDEQEVDR